MYKNPKKAKSDVKKNIEHKQRGKRRQPELRITQGPPKKIKT